MLLKGCIHMRNIYTVEQFEILHNELHFSLNENGAAIQITPAGQVIADSDQLSFIYLVEEGNEYSYLSFPQSIWSSLVQLLQQELTPYIVTGNERKELVNFNDELQMLIFNIEGNDNYGSLFVTAVENDFQAILQNDTI